MQLGITWDIIRKISCEKSKPIKVSRLDGSLPSEKTEILTDWHTYFSTFLNNRNANSCSENCPVPNKDIPKIKTTKIT